MNPRLLILVALAGLAPAARADIDYVKVKECRNWIFGKETESDAQEAIDKKLKDELNKAGAKVVFHIQYGDMETFFRSKKSGNACIIATAWFSR